MKKNGFTLAEILIALSIVGVVAAISIPGLVMENKKKVWANSLSTAASNFENALTSYLVTENEQLHSLSQEIGLDSRVYTIESFIEKCSIEYRNLDDSKGAIVRICKFGSLSINDSFFTDFKREYNPYFVNWFNNKADDDVFISTDKKGRLKALLKLKIEFLITCVDK